MADGRAKRLAGTLSHEQFNWRPSPEAWSAWNTYGAGNVIYDVNRIRFKNPFVPLIRFTVGTGLEIVSQHESRHLLQAERIRESPGFPA